ncbi:hypothetical protein AUR04nite_12430 [Glutamicibacter uratoxydans]|uniref:N-acetyltransferase domain-containing protein n=1 Tax=Glutamicibacter uratoxydans TaxID=43667 RepID=A0A4Y4DT93_GLUUR|nr:GNAT family N-acetyltransferase [Glutamicibacter uratoxydans]GED05711.1 hypothetical protein AUR04nite_12430 [Glutamicibacter uratoxydans]
MNFTVKLAHPDQLEAAAEVLADAFDSSEWTRWIIPAEGYRDRLFKLQLLYLTHAMDHGLVLVDNQLRAVAALMPASAPDPSIALQEQMAALHGDRLARLEAHLDSVPFTADWTLSTIGVKAEHQAQGLGSALLTAALHDFIPIDSSVTLETSDAGNVRFYENFGFAVVDKFKPKEGPSTFTMFREPRAAN